MNTFGKLFKVEIFGESHGPLVGAIVDGCPPGIPFSIQDIQPHLDRRAPGKGEFSTPRKEADEVEIKSGVYRGTTTGSPITLLIRNSGQRSGDYPAAMRTPRPGHADYPATVKFGGFEDPRGGGHFSGRLTAALVAAGSVARKMLAPDIRFAAHTVQVGNFVGKECQNTKDILQASAANPLGCVDDLTAEMMVEALQHAKDSGDSVGCKVECIVTGAPPGLGEPFFDSAEGELAKVMMAIPGAKGVEFGSGLEAAGMLGSENNDALVDDGSGPYLHPNNAGGFLGGMTVPPEQRFRVAFKPPSSPVALQSSVDLETGKAVELDATGRHDLCLAPRVLPVVESAAAIVMADLMLRYRARRVEDGR